MEEEMEYLEPARIRTLINTYCDFMSVPVQLEGETINKMEAPWRKSARDLSDQDYIDLYNYLYPFQGDPLLWVHLNTDYPYNLHFGSRDTFRLLSAGIKLTKSIEDDVSCLFLGTVGRQPYCRVRNRGSSKCTIHRRSAESDSDVGGYAGQVQRGKEQRAGRLCRV
jgi:hypothetical protein